MLLNYSHHTSPTGLSDVLDKLATFAAAQGWTTELQINKDWADVGGWGWQTGGSHDFLEIVSNGYGNQDLQYRFYQEYVDASEDILYYCAIEPGAGAYSAISTLPHMQDRWNDTSGYQQEWHKMSCPNSTTPEVWFVGNDKFIAVHWKTTAYHVQSFAVGTADLISEFQDTDEVNFMWNGHSFYVDQEDRIWSNATDNRFRWWSCYGRQLDVLTYSGIKWIYWDGDGQAFTTKATLNLRYHSGDYDDDPGTHLSGDIDFNVYPNCCAFNAFTQKRVLMRPTLWLLNPDMTGTFVAAGHLPVYFLNVDGLVAGDIIEAGNEEYICFPACFTNNIYGVAYRIV